MMVLNLMLFWGRVFPYIPLTYSLHGWVPYLHFRYLKCLVTMLFLRGEPPSLQFVFYRISQPKLQISWSSQSQISGGQLAHLRHHASKNGRLVASSAGSWKVCRGEASWQLILTPIHIPFGDTFQSNTQLYHPIIYLWHPQKTSILLSPNQERLGCKCFSTNCDALCRRFRTSTLRSAPYHTTNRLPLPLWSLLSKNYCMFGKGFLPSTILLFHHDHWTSDTSVFSHATWLGDAVLLPNPPLMSRFA